MRWIVIAGIAGAAAFVASHPAMLGFGLVIGEEAAYPGWDLTRVFWADLEFARTAVARGELPVWNPYDRAGYPFLAEPQSGMFDPVTWLLVLVALILGTAPSGLIVLKAVLLFGIGAAGVAAYVRDRGAPAWVFTWAALAFVLCPRLDKLKDQSALWPTVWVGWLLLAIERFARRPTPATGVWLGLAAATVVNAGYPPGAFRVALLAIPYAAVVLVSRWRAEAAPGRRAFLVAVARAGAVATAVLVVLCAGQVWSTLQIVGETKRAALDVETVVASRTAPEHLAGLFAPMQTKQALNLYVGVAGLVGVLVALARPTARALTLVIVAGVGFVLGCGDDLPVLPALARLPGFGSFRIAGHYLVLTAVGMVLAAAVGLGRLATDDTAGPRAPMPRSLVVALALAAIGFVAVGGGGGGGGVGRILVGLVVAAALVGVAIWPRRRTLIGWTLVAWTAFDLAWAARPVAQILQPLPDPTRGEIMADAIDRDPALRVADFEWAGRRIGPREGVRDFTGHRPALTDPRYMLVYRSAPRSANLLRAMNVGVVGFADRSAATGQGKTVPVRPHRRLYRLREPWPIAFFTDDVLSAERPETALSVLQGKDAPGVVVEAVDVPPGLDPRPPSDPVVVPATLETYGLSSLTLTVEAPRDGVLLVAESFEHGWTATVDDRPVDIFRANLIFRAVPISAGSHRVVMRYAPAGVRALWWLWLAGLLAAAGWGLRALSRRRAGTPSPRPRSRTPRRAR